MKKLIIASALVSLFIVTPIAFMAFDRIPPYEYDAARSYVVPSQTNSGRQMTVHWHFARVNRVCVGSITRRVVDQESGIRFSYDPTAAARSVELEDTKLVRTFFLPQDVTPGKKWYFADAEFACNPLQRFYPLRVRTPRLSFEVLQ